MVGLSSDWSIEEAERIYGVSRWGGGYFKIGDNGNVHVVPNPSDPSVRIDFKAVIDEILQEGVQLPVVVRFHDVLRSQVANLNTIFK
ncbi:MAG: arginine decarboxylase, partial [Pseudomonadota bacterium]|nr:arginine decarboxylase [Pseudomonadota bacterium]